MDVLHKRKTLMLPDKPEDILLTYRISDDKFIFGTLPENPIQPLPSTSRHSYVSKLAPESNSTDACQTKERLP
jgi:hypothetical protein